ncbi:MAG: MBL fold metallo-hydrolase [Planctomycetota bacterium]|jgi:L-ascorbate metabolism protein UlaG (beta-lactamase superfamily)
MRVSRLFVLGLAAGLFVWGCERRETEAEQGEERKETNIMAVTIQWLGHASFKISGDGDVVYIDPWKLGKGAHDATVVLVSHSHYDHYSAEDIAKAAGPDTEIVGSGDVIAKERKGQAIKPGETVMVGGASITAVASYNPSKQFHPKANNWLGFVVDVGSKRIYYAGDTDLTGEMKQLSGIDVALLPVGGTYTMNAEEAAEAVGHIKPKQAIAYHWGDIVGKRSDAERFAENAQCEVTVLKAGESLKL